MLPLAVLRSKAGLQETLDVPILVEPLSVPAQDKLSYRPRRPARKLVTKRATRKQEPHGTAYALQSS